MLPSMLFYGRTGIGKSAAVIRALGRAAYWLAFERNALGPATNPEVNPSGDIPDHHLCLSIDDPTGEANKVLDVILPLAAKRVYRAVVVDTLSTLAQREMARIHKAGVKDDYGKASRLLGERLMGLVHRIMQVDCMVICLCHENGGPATIEGNFKPGGPDLPGKSLLNVPSQFDMVYRGGLEFDTEGKRKRVFKVDSLDPLWFTKDRWAAIKEGEPAPMESLLEILRIAAKRSKLLDGPANAEKVARALQSS